MKESEKEAESFVPEASEGGQNAALVIALLIASFTTFSKVAFSFNQSIILYICDMLRTAIIYSLVDYCLSVVESGYLS